MIEEKKDDNATREVAESAAEDLDLTDDDAAKVAGGDGPTETLSIPYEKIHIEY